MTQEQLVIELAKVKAENEALKAANARKHTLSCKVTEKGGVSVYGLGRFPVSLYKTQWLKLIGFIKEIEAFIQANDAELTVKETKKSA